MVSLTINGNRICISNNFGLTKVRKPFTFMYWSRMYLSLSNSVNVAANCFTDFTFAQDKLISPSSRYSPRKHHRSYTFPRRRFDTRTNEGEILLSPPNKRLRIRRRAVGRSLVRVWLWNVLYETILSLSRPSFIIIIIEAIRRSKRRLSGHREKGFGSPSYTNQVVFTQCPL